MNTRSSATAATASAAGNGVTVAGPLTALNPADGLFLRAEHLQQIQEFAAALAATAGQAAGTGVVYGYALSLDQTGPDQTGPALQVGPGLAVNRLGLPLLTASSATLLVGPEHRPPLDADGFWVVELTPDSEAFGTENVYGNLCADPCQAGSAIHPWIRSLVRVSLRADTMPGLSSIQDARRRNWLASAYFERERQQGDPWLVPGATPGQVASVLGRSWTEAGAAPHRASVPIGVLQPVGDGLGLDVWTARRELSGPPGVLRWAWHLAMRPWSVYLAQLLQFQDQLGALVIPQPEIARLDVVDSRGDLIEELIKENDEHSALGRLNVFKEFVARWQQNDQPYALADVGATLPELGFGELPPAGYLPAYPQLSQAQIGRWFGDAVDLTFCDVRADAVAGAVQAAQHLDRIPLEPGSLGRPQVDILLPSEPADLAATRTEAYGWVAFIRHSRVCCEPAPAPTEPVDVYLSTMDADLAVEVLSAGTLPDPARMITRIDYPAGSAQLPPGTIERPHDLPDTLRATVIAVASAATGEDLMAERAKVLANAWVSDPVDVRVLTSPTFPRPLLVLIVETEFR